MITRELRWEGGFRGELSLTTSLLGTGLRGGAEVRGKPWPWGGGGGVGARKDRGRGDTSWNVVGRGATPSSAGLTLQFLLGSSRYCASPRPPGTSARRSALCTSCLTASSRPSSATPELRAEFPEESGLVG